MTVHKLIRILEALPGESEVVVDVEARAFGTHFVAVKGCYHDPEVGEMAPLAVLTVAP